MISNIDDFADITVIRFETEHGLLSMGKSTSEAIYFRSRGNSDNKLFCPSATAAYTAVRIIETITGSVFYPEHEGSDVIWRRVQ